LFPTCRTNAAMSTYKIAKFGLRVQFNEYGLLVTFYQTIVKLILEFLLPNFQHISVLHKIQLSVILDEFYLVEAFYVQNGICFIV